MTRAPNAIPSRPVRINSSARVMPPSATIQARSDLMVVTDARSNARRPPRKRNSVRAPRSSQSIVLNLGDVWWQSYWWFSLNPERIRDLIQRPMPGWPPSGTDPANQGPTTRQSPPDPDLPRAPSPALAGGPSAGGHAAAGRGRAPAGLPGGAIRGGAPALRLIFPLPGGGGRARTPVPRELPAMPVRQPGGQLRRG